VTRHAMLRWCLVAGVLLAAAVWAGWKRFCVAPADLLIPLGAMAVLGAACWHFRRRGIENFVVCLVALMQIVLFSTGYVLLTYVGATLNRPLIDGRLMQLDHLLGCYLPAVVAWQTAHPAVNLALAAVYDTMFAQTAAVVVILGFAGDRQALESFVLRFMLGAVLILPIFFAFPAEGPFTAYGYGPSESQSRYLDHLQTLRSGQWNTFNLRTAEGLITFPSFHTTWALLIALAFAHRRLLRWPFLLLNLAVVVSTVTTGWHYLSDVMAGVLVCAVAVLATRAIEGWLATAEGIGSRSCVSPRQWAPR